jgi:hypothetical protein
MAMIPRERLTITPPFYFTQADCYGPLRALSLHNQRSELSIHALVFTCIVTSCTFVYALEVEDTTSIVKAILRHSMRFGIPKVLFLDLGAILIKGSSVKLDMRDLQSTLNRDLGMECCPEPTQAHCERGRVERVIKTLQTMFKAKEVVQQKQSILSWETTFSVLSNSLNNLPMARTSEAGG